MRKIILSNRRYLVMAIGFAILQIIIFKLAYPFPDFISDSYDYIETATFHLNVNLWPIGYARFLWVVHLISPSDTLLVVVQYFILETALGYLFFYILRRFQPSRLTSNVLFIFLLLNPFALYLSNAVLSDALFTALSIVWLVLLTDQFYRPRLSSILIAALIIGICFTLRYTAIYYPIVTALALLLSRHKAGVKIAGILAPLVLMVPFVLFTQSATKKVTGTPEFSVFGGWQLANNALYMYGHIQVDPHNLPPETRGIDSLVKYYYKHAPPGYFDFYDFPGTFFIKHQHAPLKEYMYIHYAKELNSNQFEAWGKVSPIYNKYAIYLMSHYPVDFAQYYLWLNVRHYFDPFPEKFEIYNFGEDSVWQLAQYWFHWKTPAVRSISRDFQAKLFFPYGPIFAIVNIYFAGCLIWLLTTGKIKKFDANLRTSLYFIAGFLLINFAFSVFATPIVLRYELIPFVFLFVYDILLMEVTDREAFKKREEVIMQGEKKKASEAVLTFGVLLPVGILGGLFCLLALIIISIINLVSFLFLLLCGFSSLVYGYISRNLGYEK